MSQLQRDITEIKDRLRRTETRVTKWLESQGFATGVQKPTWFEEGIIQVPTRACSINDCLSVVPPTWPEDKGIDVFVERDYLLTFYTTPED